MPLRRNVVKRRLLMVEVSIGGRSASEIIASGQAGEFSQYSGQVSIGGRSASEIIASGGYSEAEIRSAMGGYQDFRPSRARVLADMRAAQERQATFERDQARLKEIERIKQEKVFLSQKQAGELSRLRRLDVRSRIEESKERAKEKEEVVATRTIRIDPRTGKPFGRVTRAKTRKEQFRELRKERGPLTGSLIFAGESAERITSDVALGRAGPYKGVPIIGVQPPYQPQALGRAAKVGVEYAPYVTPAAPVVLIVTGIESYATRGGREQIRLTGERIEERTGLPKEVAWAGPSLKVVAGGYGIKSRIKGVRAKTELKKFESKPFKVEGVRFEGEKRGVDVLIGTKKVGKVKYVSRVEVPFYKTKAGKRFVIEEGKMISFRYKKPRIDVRTYDITGKGEVFKGQAKLVSPGKGPLLKRELPADIQIGVGVTKLKGTAQATGKIRAGYDLYTGKARGTLKVKAKPFKETLQVPFTSVGRGDKVITTIDADIQKLYASTLTDQVRLMGKVTSYGKVRRIQVPSKDKIVADFIKPAKIKKTPLVTTFQKLDAPVISVQEVMKAGARPLISSPSTPSLKVISPTPTIQKVSTQQVRVISPQKVSPLAVEFTKSRLSSAFLTSQAVKPALKTRQITKQREQQTAKVSLKTAQLVKQAPVQKVSLVSLQALKQMQRQAQVKLAPAIPTPARSFKTPLKLPPFFFLPKVRRGPGRKLLGESYGVQIRRFGVFRPIGARLSLKKAFSIGQTRVGRTLGATFKITGPSPKGFRTPKGFYQKPTKEGILFIEKRKFRLSTPPEIKEIISAKRRKR